LEEADQLADRIGVLSAGVIVANGSPAELKGQTGGEVVELRDELGRVIREVPTDGTVRGLRRAIDQLDATAPEGTVTLRKPSLDDVFLALTSNESIGASA